MFHLIPIAVHAVVAHALTAAGTHSTTTALTQHAAVSGVQAVATKTAAVAASHGIAVPISPIPPNLLKGATVVGALGLGAKTTAASVAKEVGVSALKKAVAQRRALSTDDAAAFLRRLRSYGVN
jgi:hypothetical protein